jgi:hypothetical protein
MHELAEMLPLIALDFVNNMPAWYRQHDQRAELKETCFAYRNHMASVFSIHEIPLCLPI